MKHSKFHATDGPAPEGPVAIIEDDDSVRKVVRRTLATAGIQSIEYSSAEDYLLEGVSSSSCIVLDLQLPGIQGLEFLSRLRANGDTSPIIVLSGSADATATLEALRLGAIYYLQKPFRTEQLLDVVRNALLNLRTS